MLHITTEAPARMELARSSEKKKQSLKPIETREVSVKMKDHRALLWEPAVREVAATIEEYLIRHSRNANAVFKEKTAETPVTGSRASRIA